MSWEDLWCPYCRCSARLCKCTFFYPAGEGRYWKLIGDSCFKPGQPEHEEHALYTDMPQGGIIFKSSEKKDKMTKEELLKIHQELCTEAFELMKAKNHDYTGGRGPFANFELTEQAGITSTEKGLLVRILDKISRLSTYAEKGELKVKNEGVRDIFLDLINYSVLYAAYLKSKENENN